MTAGIPGTGITAIFYFLLVLLMPLHETYRTLRGRSSRARWRRVLALNAMAWGIATVLWAEGWLLGRLLFKPAVVVNPDGSMMEVITQNVLTTAALATATATLIAIIAVMHLLRLMFARPTVLHSAAGERDSQLESRPAPPTSAGDDAVLAEA